MFTEQFDNFVCFGDSISCEVDGLMVTARIEHDIDYHIDDDDCHNTDQSVTGCNDEQFAKLLDARKAWLNDEWHYCSVVLSVAKNGIDLDHYAASLHGIDVNYPGSNNAHLNEIAAELLPEAIEAGKSTLKQLCEC